MSGFARAGVRGFKTSLDDIVRSTARESHGQLVMRAAQQQSRLGPAVRYRSMLRGIKPQQLRVQRQVNVVRGLQGKLPSQSLGRKHADEFVDASEVFETGLSAARPTSLYTTPQGFPVADLPTGWRFLPNDAAGLGSYINPRAVANAKTTAKLSRIGKPRWSSRSARRRVRKANARETLKRIVRSDRTKAIVGGAAVSGAIYGLGRALEPTEM